MARGDRRRLLRAVSQPPVRHLVGHAGVRRSLPRERRPGTAAACPKTSIAQTLMEKILTASSQPIVRTDWPQALPVLSAGRVVLRELRREDATSLCALLSTEEVARFISPPPTTVDGFERFFQFVHAQRAAGEH